MTEYFRKTAEVQLELINMLVRPREFCGQKSMRGP
jgi:hypothetical protein